MLSMRACHLFSLLMMAVRARLSFLASGSAVIIDSNSGAFSMSLAYLFSLPWLRWSTDLTDALVSLLKSDSRSSSQKASEASSAGAPSSRS